MAMLRSSFLLPLLGLFIYRSVCNELLSNNTVLFCNSTLTPVVIDAYSVTPDTPTRGKPLSFTLEIELQEVLVEAKFEINVKFEGTIPVFSDAYSLCALLSYTNLSCPVDVGTLHISSSVVLPDHTPSGFYVLDATMTDSNAHAWCCSYGFYEAVRTWEEGVFSCKLSYV